MPSRLRFPGARVLVTGAASGIGLACARAFAGEGARVALTDLREDALGVAAATFGTEAMALKLDVADEGDWTNAMERLRAAWGGLDVVVANAGLSRAHAVVETSLEEWRSVMAVNLDGVFLAAKHGLPLMGAGGAMVVVSSASGLKATPGACAYATSKAGARHLARSLALEVADRGIRVNTVLPAGVMTSMWEDLPLFHDLVAQHGTREAAFAVLAQTTPLQRFATPEEIAAAVLFLASSDATTMTGAEIVIDGGYTL